MFRVLNTVADDAVNRVCHEFVDADDNWGCDDLLRIEDLLKPASGYIKNNTVIIECSITAFRSPVSDLRK
ncbi:hypothetical protein AAVH_31728, partial [Aphelenchoides avenae]